MKTREINKRLQVQTQTQIQAQVPEDWQAMADVQGMLIEERDQQIAELQREMTDVRDLFQEIAWTVEEQGDQVNNIQTKVQQAMNHVDGGKKQIEKANESSKRSCVLI